MGEEHSPLTKVPRNPLIYPPTNFTLNVILSLGDGEESLKSSIKRYTPYSRIISKRCIKICLNLLNKPNDKQIRRIIVFRSKEEHSFPPKRDEVRSQRLIPTRG